jgi:hypothetical protein
MNDANNLTANVTIYCQLKVTTQKSAYVDGNPVIATVDDKIVLAKRIKGIVGGGKWHLPRG